MRTAAAIFPYLAFDPRSRVPFYKQIYDGYREAILAGRLRRGQRLPSTRALAAELKISRLPVLNAFEQLLHEGYLEGKAGAGTFVRDSIPDELSKPLVVKDGRTKVRRIAAAAFVSEGIGPFRVSLPALDRFPREIWGRLVARHGKRLPIELMAYGDPAGHAPLREAIASYVRAARAVNCEAAQVLIVSGSQMALQLCALALLKPGDSVFIEDPGYPGARDALQVSGAKVIPVQVDSEGIDVARIASQRKRARVAYVTPSHQYPLGVSMTASRRLELLDWARRTQSWILEDDYDSEYRYASRPLGALQGMDTSDRVIYIGTFSKVLFPALRVGYMIIPPDLVGSFVRLRESLDIFSPTLYQLVLTDFLNEGHFARHLRRMRSVYHGRRDAMVHSLEKHLGSTLEPYNTDAGLHLSGFLPRGIEDREVVRRAAQAGVVATALSSCYAGEHRRSGLILGFGGASERRIQAAASMLARVIESLRFR